jgi:choline-sulfatase
MQLAPSPTWYSRMSMSQHSLGEKIRDVVTRIVVAAMAAVVVACGSATPPSVVLIVVDTLRADAVGPYGGIVNTPTLDRLAETGVVIEGACTPTPSTGPAHASLMTGLHPWNHGVLRNAVPLADESLRLAPQFQQAGYETAAFVSSYNISRFGFEQGFDRFDYQPSHRHNQKPFWRPGSETTDAALHWLADREDTPFVLWVHYFDPHAPYTAPAGFERPQDEAIDLSGKPGMRPQKQRSLRRIIRGYRANVAYTDAQIGRLLAALRDEGQLDHTIVVVTSDHGEGLGDHGLIGHGRNLHDELVEIPLLIRAPGLPANRRLRGPAQLEDMMPTLLSLTGLPVPPQLDGFDLTPWLAGKSPASPRNSVVGRLATIPDSKELFFTRHWPQKWIGELDGNGVAYDLDNDPGETTRKTSTELPAELTTAAADSGNSERQQKPDAETLQALEALGYLDGGEGVPAELR